MKCSICGKAITLTPSLAERKRKDAERGIVVDYASIFTAHSSCQLEKRKTDTSELIKRCYS